MPDPRSTLWRTAFASITASLVFAACGAADNLEVPSGDSAPGASAEASDDQYRRVLEQSLIANVAGDLEVLVREHAYPPAWKAPRHYHDGDLFIYVASGEFEVVTEGRGRVVYKSGQAVRMNSGTEMDARNVSETTTLKLVIFQVGRVGDPFLVPVDQG